MNISGNTILITGGGAGHRARAGRGILKAGNQVIIAGRRRSALDEATSANPGMKGVTLDIAESASIGDFGAKMAREFSKLNVVIHNAGIMKLENLLEGKVEDAEAMVTTNLLGPIRLNAALLPLLRRQPHSTIMTVSSGLAFLPLAMTPTYCATKAALHSYTQSLRWQLKDTTTQVIELIPPYVQTELMGPQQKQDPRAMPLPEFVAEVMQIIQTQPTATEINVERVKPLRFAAESGNLSRCLPGLNQAMQSPHEH